MAICGSKFCEAKEQELFSKQKELYDKLKDHKELIYELDAYLACNRKGTPCREKWPNDNEDWCEPCFLKSRISSVLSKG